jgi:hypothetical protein
MELHKLAGTKPTGDDDARNGKITPAVERYYRDFNGKAKELRRQFIEQWV